MEVKINKDIREFTENVFFGLSFRQFVFSILACIVAVALYFILRANFSIGTLSWVCILGATPFAVLGFVKINGLTAEKFIIAFIKSEFIMPKKLLFKPVNIYDERLKNKAKEKNKKKKDKSDTNEKKKKRRLKIHFSID